MRASITVPGPPRLPTAHALVTGASSGMKPQGVHVTTQCLGMAWIECHDVNGMRPRVSCPPRRLWQAAEMVTRPSLDAGERGDARCATGRVNRTLAGLSRPLPESLARALVASRGRDFHDAD